MKLFLIILAALASIIFLAILALVIYLAILDARDEADDIKRMPPP